MTETFVKILSILAKKKERKVSIPTSIIRQRKRTPWEHPAHGVTHTASKAKLTSPVNEK